MKRWGIIILMIAAVLLLAAPVATAADSTAWGPSILSGIGVAYAVHGPANREWFTNAYAGAKVLQLDHGAVYACYQYVASENADWGGNGAKLMLTQAWKDVPQFTWGTGIGFISKIKERPDTTSTKIAGLSFDGALSYDASQLIDITAFVTAVDGGPRFHFMVAVLFTLKDAQKLIPGL